MPYTGFPDLDLAAVRGRQYRPLAFWYGARLLDRRGSGSVSVGAIGPGLPASTRWRMVREGSGTFWHVADVCLFLRGPGAVAATLEVPRLTAAYEGPATWLKGHGQLLRARLFLNAVALLRNRRPIAVSTMAALGSVSRRTIFRWQQLTGWGRIVNAALLERLRDRRDGPHVDKRSRDGRMLRVHMHDGIWLAVRLPNSLEPGRPPARKRKVLRRANTLLQSCHSWDRGERQQIYLPPGQQHLPSLPSQYHPWNKANGPPVQLWIPGGVPKRWVTFLK